MGITVGPGINIGPGISLVSISSYVTSGLIAYVDAGVSASYAGTGTTWTDLSGLGNNFTLSGTTPWTSAGNQSYFTFASGIAQGGNILPNSAYTKMIIFRVTGAFGNLISGDSGSQHAFWGANTQYLQSGHNGNSGGSWSTVVSATTVPANQWAFGAVSFSTTTGWRLYLGQQAPVTNADTSTFGTNPGTVEIGGFDGNANNANADIAASLIYNRVLSGTEITQNYNYFKTRYSIG